MTEHGPEHTPAPRPAETHNAPDWRRLEVAEARFADRIAEGTTAAHQGGRELDIETARCIAHVLSRALGPDSALAEFGQTGDGSYEDLRDEYLTLYADDTANPTTKEAIDWLGAYLVTCDHPAVGHRHPRDHHRPRLDTLLVPTTVDINGQPFNVHFPAHLDSQQISGIVETLTLLQLDEDEALQAYLSLPDVSAGADDIMQSFHDVSVGTFQSAEEALRRLSPLEEWENHLADWCIDQGIDPEALEWNLQPLIERLYDVYEFVDWKGQIHGFVR